MTERLYHADSMLREFSARVVARHESDRGPAVQLDRTAFYPTSGGQPYDTGKLNDIAVLDVWEDESGEIWHRLERFPQGDAVRGQIDWERRFDHMQQHSGQHLLSGAFKRVLKAPTVSFHLGTEESFIDLDFPELDWDSVFRVEAEVNRVIWENKPMEVHVVDQAEIHKIPLRRPPQVSGKIRVIWIRDYDAVACGGTHVSHTGAVGLVKVTRVEHYKGGMRVGFLCGKRALLSYQRVLRGLQEASADLSVHTEELGEAVARLQDETKQVRRALRAAHGELAALEAERLWSAAPEDHGARQVVAHLQERTFDQAVALATQLSSRPSTVVLLAVSDAKGTRLVCQRSDDLPQADAAAILRRAAETLGGRGGGTAAQAQGGAPARPRKAILEALRSAITA
ncbi:MAG: alanyl-tRNA editing protein [Gemmatimonadota bacterium]|nr:MAG: alanyl-tRNA editing protein [Gemmatimonadota bacterium]